MLRCFANEAAAYICMGDTPTFNVIAMRVIGVILMTIIVQYTLSKKKMDRAQSYW